MMNEKPCTYPGCDFLAFVACAHAALCEEHAFGDMCSKECCDELGAFFVRFLRDVCAPAMRLGGSLALIRVPLLEMYAEFYEHFYPAYRERYDEEGAPFGPSDASMWRWHEERFSPAVEIVEPSAPVLRLAGRGGQLVH